MLCSLAVVVEVGVEAERAKGSGEVVKVTDGTMTLIVFMFRILIIHDIMNRMICYSKVILFIALRFMKQTEIA
jgi:hypothetical protein